MALIWTCFLLQCQTPSSGKAYEFANGLWFEGYEASFLALNGHPIEEFENVTKIEMRVKQGNIF